MSLDYPSWPKRLKLIRRSELSQFAKNLQPKMPISQNWLYPLWHSPWVMLMAMTCLCLEWTIRRVRGWHEKTMSEPVFGVTRYGYQDPSSGR